MNSAGISSSDSIYATNNIEAVGNMLCTAISTYGVNGIGVYNGATLNASMNQAGAVTGTTLTITNASTSTTPSLIKSFDNGNFAILGNITTNALSCSQVSVPGNIALTGTITSGGNTVLTTTYNLCSVRW